MRKTANPIRLFFWRKWKRATAYKTCCGEYAAYAPTCKRCPDQPL